jgi:hypothetical protein
MLFRKFFPVIIISAIVIAIFMSLYSWYQSRALAHNQEIGNLFLQLISGEHSDSNMVNSSLETIITTGKNRQVELASLKLASNKMIENDVDGALESFANIVDNKDFYKLTTSYARIMWVSLILDKQELSQNEQMRARDYLQYFSDENQEFYASATLLKAFFYKKNNQMDLAKENALKILKMEKVSPIIREQASAILATIAS